MISLKPWQTSATKCSTTAMSFQICFGTCTPVPAFQRWERRNDRSQLEEFYGASSVAAFAGSTSKGLPTSSKHQTSLEEASQGGVEIVASTAALSHQQGSTILSFDGKNAYNSILRSSILPAVATHTPHLVKYFGNIYARTKAKLLFKMEDGSIEIVRSQRGVQQGCNLGGFGFCVGLLDMMKEFNDKPPVPGAKLIGYVDDLQVHLPPGLARNIQAIATVTNWIQNHLLQKGIELSLPKSKVLFPRRIILLLVDKRRTARFDENGSLCC